MKSATFSLLGGARESARLFVLCVGLAAAVQLSSADAQGAVVTTLTALKYEVSQNANGESVETLATFTKVLPGESLRYVVEFVNEGSEAASGVVVSLPIPAEMTYVAGSADQAGTDVEFSVDGGAPFGALENLSVTDGLGRTRPATVSDVRAVRWTLSTALPAGSRGEVGIRAILK